MSYRAGVVITVVLIVLFLIPDLAPKNEKGAWDIDKLHEKNTQAILEDRKTLASQGLVDYGLQSCILDSVARDQVTDWKLLLPGVTSLYCTRRNIRSLEGIDILSSLQFLDLRNNQVVDIAPVLGLSGLSHLRLQGNPVTDLKPLKKVGTLKVLGLPDLPSIPCKDLDAWFPSVNLNLSAIKCHRDSSVVSLSKKRKAKEEEFRKPLTYKEQEELFRYEEQYMSR